LPGFRRCGFCCRELALRVVLRGVIASVDPFWRLLYETVGAFFCCGGLFLLG
jgi:hypothetical protein